MSAPPIPTSRTFKARLRPRIKPSLQAPPRTMTSAFHLSTDLPEPFPSPSVDFRRERSRPSFRRPCQAAPAPRYLTSPHLHLLPREAIRSSSLVPAALTFTARS